MIEHYMHANGLHHHVVTWGANHPGDTVLMCHGFLDMGLGFFKLAPLLSAAGYRVVAFDFRGHGESAWVGRGGYYHFADYVLDLHELVPQLLPADVPFHLLGHSMGGTIATLYAATHGPRIKTLTLLEGFGPPAEPTTTALDRMHAWLSGVEALRAGEDRVQLASLEAAIGRLARRHPTLDAETLRFLAEKSTEPHPRAAGLTWRFDPLHRTPSPIGFDVARFLEFARMIERPTLAIQGEHGLRTGDDAARIAAYPRVQARVIAGAGHMMHWTHETETARAILDFWAQS